MRVVYLDRKQATDEVRTCAEQLVQRDERVLAVGLFGSLARGEALPSSDADVLIALREHPCARWFDRILEYARAFEGTSLPVEPFPYTWEELQQMVSREGLIRTALRDIRHLAGDESLWLSLRKAHSK